MSAKILEVRQLATSFHTERGWQQAIDGVSFDVYQGEILGIVGEKVLAAYPGRILNIHPALIPSFCGKGFYGLHVHEAVLARGCKVTGATAHLVTAGVDEGPILLQKAVDVLPGDTPEILQRRVMEQAEWLLLPRAVRMLSEQVEGEK